MKILYISSLILKKGSSASIRNTGLIRELAYLNNEVDVLTIDYPEKLEDSYLKSNLQNSNIRIKKSKLKILDTYLRSDNFNTKNKINYRNNKLLKNFKEFIKDIFFFPDVDKEWIKEFVKLELDYSKYDVIISSSDTKTSHYIGRVIKSKYKKNWIQIWGDPWKDDIGLKGIKKIRAALEEKRLLVDADLILYVSPFTLKVMKQKNNDLKNKMEYLARGYLEEVKTEQKKINNENIIFTYTGVLNRNRDIFNFLEKIKMYNQNNKKKIIFEFYGRIDEKIKKEILRFDFIKIYGIVSFEKIKNIYQKSDVLIYIDNGLKTTQIPGKIYDYLGTDKKIVAIFEERNEIYDYLKEELKVMSFINQEIDIEEIIKQNNRKANAEFSNKKIAIEIIKKIKRIRSEKC